MRDMQFRPLPHGVNYGTPDMSAALERKRLEVLRNPWRPSRCSVPWTPAEASAYKEPALDDPVVRRTFRELAASGVVDAVVENALARSALNVLPFPPR